MTKGQRDRAYRVQMWGLSQEISLTNLSKEEAERRAKEIWDNCYGEEKGSGVPSE